MAGRVFSANSGYGRYLSKKDFLTGDALIKSIFGKSAIDIVYGGQIEWMSYEVQETEKEPGYLLPTPMDYDTEGDYRRDYSGNKSKLVEDTVKFAGKFRFIDSAIRYADVDFLYEINEIRKAIIAATNIPSITGNYLSSFRYIIGNISYTTLPPPGTDFTVIGITNIATYASTQENPTWYRPFNVAWASYVRARAKALGYDAVFKYIKEGSVPYFRQAKRIDPNRPNDKTPRWMRYAVPTIQIGPYGSLKVTGKPRARHRRFRRKMI